MIFPNAASLNLPPTRFALKARPYFIGLLGAARCGVSDSFWFLSVGRSKPNPGSARESAGCCRQLRCKPC